MASPTDAKPAASRFPLHLLAFVALALLEFLHFDAQTSKHHTWIYPRWNDQIQYLTESYTGYEYAREHGVGAGLWHTLVNPSAQGTLHDFFAVIVFELAGPSRSAALALNLLALLAWQAALLFAVTRVAGSRALGWAAAALPLALRWPWNDWAGSTIDFRLDHLAMCAFGVTAACALLTDELRSTRWSAAFGAAVGLTLLTRFLTGTYFALILLALLVRVATGPERRRRSGNLLLASGIAVLLAGPVFWLNRLWVWNYYWIGHFTGPESALRNPHMGLGRSLDFVWGHLFRDHLGACFGCIALGGTLLLVAGAFLLPEPAARRRPRSTAGICGWGALFLLAPALVLTLHQQKSEIVVGALAPGAVLLLVGGWLELLRRSRAPLPGVILAAAAMAVSAGFFVSQTRRTGYDDAFAVDARKVNTLADYIYAHARAAGLAEPRVGVDQVTDCLDGQVLRVISYERHRVWVPFVMTLPTGIAEEKEALLLERLAGSDFILLTEDGPVGGWPYDREMRALLPQTQAWCEAHLKFVERFTLFGRRMVLYQRREIP